jgi:hypothetical protein
MGHENPKKIREGDSSHKNIPLIKQNKERKKKAIFFLRGIEGLLRFLYFVYDISEYTITMNDGTTIDMSS